MPSFKPIQLIPPGLLGFFQLKQEGRGLVELPDVLQGTVDLLDWYFQSRAEWDQTLHGVVLNAAGRNGFEPFAPNTIQVPAREFWWVSQYSVQALPQPGAGTATLLQLQATMVAQAVGTLRPVAIGPQISGALGTANHQAIAIANGFFAPAGAVLGFAWGADIAGGGTIDVNGFVRFARLPI